MQKQYFRKESLRYPWQLITMGGSIWVFLRFIYDIPKAFALCTTLSLGSLNISLTVTPRADYHAVFLRLQNLVAHFSPFPLHCRLKPNKEFIFLVASP